MDNNTLSEKNDYIEEKIKQINPILNKHLDFFSYYINKNKNFFTKEKELSEKIALTLLKNKLYDNAFYFLSEIKSCFLKLKPYHDIINNFYSVHYNRDSRFFEILLFSHHKTDYKDPLYHKFYYPDSFAIEYDNIDFYEFCLNKKYTKGNYHDLFLFIKIEYILALKSDLDIQSNYTKHLEKFFPNFESYIKLFNQYNSYENLFSYYNALSLTSYNIIFKHLNNTKTLIINTLINCPINSNKFKISIQQEKFNELNKKEKIEILDEKIEQFPFYQDRESFKNAIEDYRIFYKSFDITMNENNHIQFKLLSTTLNQIQELGNEEIIQRLTCFKDLDFNINVLDQNNETILFKFVEKYINEDKILLLYSLQSLGFDLTIRNKDNLSILDYLEEHNYSFLKNTLLQIKVKMEQFELNQEFNKPIKKQHRL